MAEEIRGATLLDVKKHRRRWQESETWCGRPLTSVKLARRTTPADEVCRTCVNTEEHDQREFVRLAELITEALWRSGIRL